MITLKISICFFLKLFLGVILRLGAKGIIELLLDIYIFKEKNDKDKNKKNDKEEQ